MRPLRKRVPVVILDIVLPRWDFAVLAIPKCGSSTLRTAFDATGFMPRDFSKKFGTRIAIIRNPVERFLSAYRMLWVDDYPLEEILDWGKEHPHFNMHIIPQTDFVRGDATEYYCLEDIAEWWPQLHQRYPDIWPEVAPHKNRTAPNDVGRDRYNEIAALYPEDMELWEAHRGHGN